MYVANGKIIEDPLPAFPSSRGCFETVLVSSGKIHYLIEHLHRAERTLQLFYGVTVNDPRFWPNLTDSISRLVSTVKQKGLFGSVDDLRLKIVFWLPDPRLPSFGSPDDNPIAYQGWLQEFHAPNSSLVLGLIPNLDHYFAPAEVGHKLLNYGPYIHLLNMARAQGCDDGVRIGSQGEVLESSKHNLFFLRGQTLITPPADNVLPGVIRGQILQACLGIQVVEQVVRVNDLSQMDGCFVTNSLVQAQSVRKIGDFRFAAQEQLLNKIKAWLLNHAFIAASD